MSNPCGDFQRSGHLTCLGALGLFKECHPWCTMKEDPNYKLITMLMNNQVLPLKFHFKVTFSWENYSVNCKSSY